MIGIGMAMDPQKKSALMEYTTAVKVIIYDAGRMEKLLPMLDTKSGAIAAVQTVMSVIEQKKPIPPGIIPLLAVNTYMLMVDMAREITEQEPDPAIVNAVTQELLATMQSYGQGKGQPQGQPQEQAPQQPQGQSPQQPQQAPQGIMQKAMA